MDWQPHIVVDAGVLLGKPVVRGTRLGVDFIVGLLADGWTMEQLLDEYPGLTRLQIRACLAYAASMISTERVFLRAS